MLKLTLMACVISETSYIHMSKQKLPFAQMAIRLGFHYRSYVLPLQISEGVTILEFWKQYNIKIQKTGARVESYAKVHSRF